MPHRLKLKTPAEIAQILPARAKPIGNKGKLPDLAAPYLDFLTRSQVAEAVAEFIPFMYEQAILHNRRLADEYPKPRSIFGLSARRAGRRMVYRQKFGQHFLFRPRFGRIVT